MAPQLTLETVEDYVDDARILLLDAISPYRYDDASLLTCINVALLEARRLRPDLFVYKHGGKVPHFVAVDETVVGIEPQFRLAILCGMVWHALMRDQEDLQDERANMFLSTFQFTLTGVRVPAAKPNSGSTGG